MAANVVIVVVGNFAQFSQIKCKSSLKPTTPKNPQFYLSGIASVKSSVMEVPSFFFT